MIDFWVKKDSTAPWLRTLSDDSGPINLTGNQSVKIWLRNEHTGVVKVNGGTCTVVTAAAGAIKYAPTAPNVDTAGDYQTEWKVTWSDGTIDRVPSMGYAITRIEADLEA